MLLKWLKKQRFDAPGRRAVAYLPEVVASRTALRQSRSKYIWLKCYSKQPYRYVARYEVTKSRSSCNA